MTGPVRADAVSRRTFIAAAGGALAAGLPATQAPAQSMLFALKGDDGKPVVNYRAPAELTAFDLPGVIWAGPAGADVVLVEFFDYNCPYCGRAAQDLDALMARNKQLRLGLVNNAILGPGSFLAAKVQQSVLRLHGPQRAMQFHRALFARRGPKDGRVALAVAGEMGLDVAAVETSADSEAVAAVMKRHIKLSSDLAFVATPSFTLNNVAMLGYPGPKALARMVAAMARCEKPVCG